MKHKLILLIAFLLLGLIDLRFAVIAVICMIAPVVVSIFKGRFWCGNLCPRGNFYDNVVSKFRKNKNVLQVSNTCVSCKLCEKKCPLGIVPYDYKGDLLSHPDCIQCGKCVTACPRKAIGYNKEGNCYTLSFFDL